MEIRSAGVGCEAEQVYVIFKFSNQIKGDLSFIGFNYFKNNENFIRLRHVYKKEYVGVWR